MAMGDPSLAARELVRGRDAERLDATPAKSSGARLNQFVTSKAIAANSAARPSSVMGGRVPARATARFRAGPL